MMARVFGVIAASILLASMLQVSGFDIDEDRGGAEQRNDFGGRDEGERGGDDLVARLDVECHQGNEERLGTGGDRDAVLRPGVFGQLAFEFSHFGAHDVLAVVEHLVDAGID